MDSISCRVNVILDVHLGFVLNSNNVHNVMSIVINALWMAVSDAITITM